MKLGLALFLPAAVVNSKGLAYANVLWLVQTGQQIIYGLVMMSLSHLSFRDVAGKLSDEAAAEETKGEGERSETSLAVGRGA